MSQGRIVAIVGALCSVLFIFFGIPLLKKPSQNPLSSPSPATPQSQPSANALATGLKSASVETRRKTALDLANLGPSAEPALPALREAVKDPDETVAFYAISALEKIGPKAVPILREAVDYEMAFNRANALRSLARIAPSGVQEVSKLLDSNDSSIRLAAAYALTASPPEYHGDAIKKLGALLKDSESAQHRYIAANGLSRFGKPALPMVLDVLKDPNARGRADAAVALGLLKDPETVPVLLDLLQSEKPVQEDQNHFQSTLAQALVRIGNAAVPGLVKILESDDQRTTQLAALALGQINDKSATPFLIKSLQSDRAHVRDSAALALAGMGPTALESENALTEAMQKDSSPMVRLAAAYALARVRPESIRGVLGVAGALQNDDPKLRLRATAALRELGPAAAEAAPALTSLLDHADPETRRGAAHALARTSGNAPESIAALRKALKDSDPSVRNHAALALGEIGKAAVPTLAQALKDEDPETRNWAAFALARNTHSDDALVALIDATRDEKTYVRLEAISALGQIGQNWRSSDQLPPLIATNAVPVLLGALKDPNSDIRRSAAHALDAIRPRDPSAIDALKNVLADPDPTVGREAAFALEQAGVHLQESIPALTHALKDEAVFIRERAQRALTKIHAKTARN